MKLVECKTKDEVLYNFYIRKKVFIEEQNVSYEDEYDLREVDGKMYLFQDDNGKYVSCARTFIMDDELNSNHKEYAIIGRIATLKEERGKGYGRLMMKCIEEKIKREKVFEVRLHAQTTAQSFYEEIGYTPYGDKYIEANLEHVMMRKYL